MQTYIALFRGINVGGNNMLTMKALVAILESLGLHNIRTYIQSGNVVFQGKSGNAAKLAERISSAIKNNHGFAPRVWLLDVGALEKAIKSNPYPEAESEPTTLHVSFLASTPPNPDLQALEKIKAASERFHLDGSVFYLHTPQGIGKSKLAAAMERLLGVAMTSRNWRTVCKLGEMAKYP